MAERHDHIKDAAKALSDLNMFAAIQALCEHSLFSSSSFRAEAQIAAICKREIQRSLRKYDVAQAKAKARP